MNNKELLELAWFSFKDYEYPKYYMGWPRPKKSYMILWKKFIVINDETLEWELQGIIRKLFYCLEEVTTEKNNLEERMKASNQENERMREHAKRILYPTSQDEPTCDCDCDYNY